MNPELFKGTYTYFLFFDFYYLSLKIPKIKGHRGSKSLLL